MPEKPKVANARTKVKKDFTWDISVDIVDPADLVKFEGELKKEGFGEVTKIPKTATQDGYKPKTDQATIDPEGGPPSGDNPVCEMHSQVMDKETVKGVPYHTYQHKNCSGEGWWGQQQQ